MERLLYYKQHNCRCSKLNLVLEAHLQVSTPNDKEITHYLCISLKTPSQAAKLLPFCSHLTHPDVSSVTSECVFIARCTLCSLFQKLLDLHASCVSTFNHRTQHLKTIYSSPCQVKSATEQSCVSSRLSHIVLERSGTFQSADTNLQKFSYYLQPQYKSIFCFTERRLQQSKVSYMELNNGIFSGYPQ